MNNIRKDIRIKQLIDYIKSEGTYSRAYVIHKAIKLFKVSYPTAVRYSREVEERLLKLGWVQAQ